MTGWQRVFSRLHPASTKIGHRYTSNHLRAKLVKLFYNWQIFFSIFGSSFIRDLCNRYHCVDLHFPWNGDYSILCKLTKLQPQMLETISPFPKADNPVSMKQRGLTQGPMHPIDSKPRQEWVLYHAGQIACKEVVHELGIFQTLNATISLSVKIFVWKVIQPTLLIPEAHWPLCSEPKFWILVPTPGCVKKCILL